MKKLCYSISIGIPLYIIEKKLKRHIQNYRDRLFQLLQVG